MAALALTALGCNGQLVVPHETASAPETSPDGGAIDVEGLLATSCGGTACHGARLPALGLDLTTPGVEERVASATSADCGGRPLVDPEDPEASYLIEKITADVPACGERMPILGAPLTPAEQDTLRAWVVALAERMR